MVIKKVTVKFDSCSECPVLRYSGCYVYQQGVGDGIPDACPIDESVMMNRYTEFKTPVKNGKPPKGDLPAFDVDDVYMGGPGYGQTKSN